ncbi:MAG: TolC family protein, partial [Candidatus Zixiibacteriota bacterium]
MAFLNRRHWIAFCAFMMVFGAICAAQAEVLTLDDCIEIALKKNQDVIRARNQVKTADGTLWTAFGEFLPSVSASISSSETHSPRYTTTDASFFFMGSVGDTLLIPPDTFGIISREIEGGGISKSYGIGASARLTLFNGGQNIFNYLSSRAGKKYYKHIEESSEQDLILNVKTYYYNYLRTIDQLTISEEAVKRGEEQYKLAKSRYEVGSASKSDVLKAQVQYGNDKLGLLAAQNNVKVAKASLAYYIGVDVNSDVEFSKEVPPKTYDGTEPEALKIGMANHPGLLASEQMLASSKNDLRSAYGQYLPTLSLDLGKNWSAGTWSRVSELNSEDSRWTFSASLSIPIFDGFSRKSNVTRAKVSLNNAQAAYYYSRNNIALGIKEAYLEIQRAHQAMGVAEE